jgi:aryl-alcohol dehydrogenase-like predicted oxidoreductase
MKTRTAVLFSLGLALVAGFAVTGSLLYTMPEGLNESAFPGGAWIYRIASSLSPGVGGSVVALVYVVLSLLAIAFVAFLLVRGSARARLGSLDASRRTFLTGAASGGGTALIAMVVAGIAAAARGLLGVGQGGRGWKAVSDGIGADVETTHEEWKESWKGSRVRDYRRFGRTDWEVSDIVLGTGRIRGEDGEQIARLAIDRGINYFDTSPDYSGAGSEQAMGRAIRGIRDKLFIATKFCTPTGHLPAGTPVAGYKQAVEGSLQRLGTDYVDLVHIHSCDSVERLMDANAHEAFDQLKQEGKVRFLGFSSHTPNLVEVAGAGIDSGRFDVMMLAYHHGIWAPMDQLIERARSEQDMGVVAMKTLKGAKHHGLAGFREHADSYAQAALTWALSNPNVSCAVISFFELQHVDEYLHASGSRLSARQLAVLAEYDRQILGTYCAPHCGACLDSCPERLPIHDILRYRMYFEDYGWEKEGMRLYTQLDPERNATRCVGCTAPCLGTCPTGIPIQERMLGAEELLRLS